VGTDRAILVLRGETVVARYPQSWELQSDLSTFWRIAMVASGSPATARAVALADPDSTSTILPAGCRPPQLGDH
jgi:hypothetical protein